MATKSKYRMQNADHYKSMGIAARSMLNIMTNKYAQQVGTLLSSEMIFDFEFRLIIIGTDIFSTFEKKKKSIQIIATQLD